MQITHNDNHCCWKSTAPFCTLYSTSKIWIFFTRGTNTFLRLNATKVEQRPIPKSYKNFLTSTRTAITINIILIRLLTSQEDYRWNSPRKRKACCPLSPILLLNSKTFHCNHEALTVTNLPYSGTVRFVRLYSKMRLENHTSMSIRG